MRNVHILPTDKPSRLHLIEDVLTFTNEYKTSVCDSEVNIYITSNEKIKVGDWFLNTLNGKLDKCDDLIYEKNVNHSNWCKKIILTDNPDLIADGVQPIDNEFLEWFVKNPSCEEVKVEKENICARCYSNDVDECWSAKECSDGRYDKIKYKIILPQEEPKQIKCYCGHTITCDCEPLQETIEEPTEEAKQRAENYMSLKGALESKQTVVDFIISQLKEHIIQSAHNQLGTNRTGDYRIGLVKAINFCEQAKEMEKQQIIEAYKYGNQSDVYFKPEQYYNETFNK